MVLLEELRRSRHLLDQRRGLLSWVAQICHSPVGEKIHINAVTDFLGSLDKNLWPQWWDAVGSRCSFPTLSSTLHHAAAFLVNAYCFAVGGGSSDYCRVELNKCARWMLLHSLACYLATPNSVLCIFHSIDPQFGPEFSPIILNWTQANYPSFLLSPNWLIEWPGILSTWVINATFSQIHTVQMS